jgi:UDP-N-acetylglucosamine 2-epimerase (non-hydrolysing)
MSKLKKEKIMFVFGTRPEAIKMAPIIVELKKQKKYFEVLVCSTGQHKEMLNQVIDFFDIKIDYDLQLMSKNQSISSLSSKILTSVSEVLSKENPTYVFVHGDTTTTAFASIAAFYNQIKICHIEAGLRTFDKYSPFPEEMNRSITGRLTDLHFAPTIGAKNNLLKENIPRSSILVTGNTVIDSLLYGIEKLKNYNQKNILQLENQIDFNKKVILVTGHRRENFGIGLENICKSLIHLAKNNDIEVVYPVHLNPNVRSTVSKLLSKISNIHLIDPLDYPAFIWLMSKSYIILTDSGGIQEEAPSLGIPVLVMRNNTERPEGVLAKTSILVGTNKNKIISNAEKLINNEKFYSEISIQSNPYGNGKSSEKIVDFLMEKISG